MGRPEDWLLNGQRESEGKGFVRLLCLIFQAIYPQTIQIGNGVASKLQTGMKTLEEGNQGRQKVRQLIWSAEKLESAAEDMIRKGESKLRESEELGSDGRNVISKGESMRREAGNQRQEANMGLSVAETQCHEGTRLMKAGVEQL